MSCCSNAKNINSVEMLSNVLATTYVLLVKTQNIHWNVKGADFGYIHSLMEIHYNSLFLAIDEIAERIRMLNSDSPATMSEFLKLSCISEKLNAKSGTEMLEELKNDHECIAQGITKFLSELSKTDDFETSDLLTSRLRFHNKVVWMLKSNLSK